MFYVKIIILTLYENAYKHVICKKMYQFQLFQVILYIFMHINHNTTIPHESFGDKSYLYS